MKHDIDKIHDRLVEYANDEEELLKYGAKNNKEKDEVERRKEKALKAKREKLQALEDDEEYIPKRSERIVMILLNSLVIILAIAIVFGLFGIYRMKINIDLQREQYRIENENKQKEFEEKQKELSLVYLETSLIDKNDREIILAYPKQFTEQESTNEYTKVFKSEFDDILTISLKENKTLEDLKNEQIEDMKKRGISIYELSEIKELGGVYYYTEKEPNSEIYNYFIGCDCGMNTFLEITIEQSSTLITSKFVEEYILYISDKLKY